MLYFIECSLIALFSEVSGQKQLPNPNRKRTLGKSVDLLYRPSLVTRALQEEIQNNSLVRFCLMNTDINGEARYAMHKYMGRIKIEYS